MCPAAAIASSTAARSFTPRWSKATPTFTGAPSPELRLERGGDRLGGEAELGEDPLVRGRGAEAVDPDRRDARSAPSRTSIPASTESRVSTAAGRTDSR